MFSLNVPISSEGGDKSFQNNVPDPRHSGKELPTFKFELEKSEGRVIDGSFGKEATVDQLPISKGIAGVSMRMEPGVMRELHWHATAAEWAFVTGGPRSHDGHRSVRAARRPTTSIPATSGISRAATGTSFRRLGDKPCHFILVFDNGYFSEFGTFSITDWLGHAPKELLAKNFGLAGVDFRQHSQERSLFRQGQDPPAIPPAPLQGWKPPPLTHKYSLLSQKPHSRSSKAGVEWRVDGSQFPISTTMTGVVLEMEPGGSARAALASQRRRVAIRARAASFSVTLFGSHGRWRQETLGKGDVGYIPQGFGHSIENIGDEKGADPHRLQYRPLPDDRPVAVDRRQSRPMCWRPISRRTRRSSRSSRARTCS